MTEEPAEIEVGDTVWVGGGRVHWSVLEIRESARGALWARLKSGQMGSLRWSRVSNLRLHSKGTAP